MRATLDFRLPRTRLRPLLGVFLFPILSAFAYAEAPWCPDAFLADSARVRGLAAIERGLREVAKAEGPLFSAKGRDLAVVLSRPVTDFDVNGDARSEEFPALLLLRSVGKDRYKLHTVTCSTIPCPACLGMDGGFKVSIRDGVLALEQSGGDVRRYTSIYRYRFEAKSNRFRLIGKTYEDVDGTDLREHHISSADYLTGEKNEDGKKSRLPDNAPIYLK